MSHIPDHTPSTREDDVSQLPALHLLQNLGFIYLSPSEALSLRGGRKSNLLLEPVLLERLAFFNRIEKRGQTHAWSETNLREAVRALKSIPFSGLLHTNSLLTDLLLLGKALPQNIDGDTKSHTLHYIDWNPATWRQNNVFHVTEEFEVEDAVSGALRRPDLVLFVNGIPFAVIECKRLEIGVGEAVSQTVRNQKSDEIPSLFTFAQLVGGVAMSEARYATTGMPAGKWSRWREDDAPELESLVRKPLSNAAKDKLFALRTHKSRRQFESVETTRLVSEQDRLLFCLFRPDRLLELARDFTLFEAGQKKIARYQQFFVVKNAVERIQKRAADDPTRGGVVWHTQGSGKTLTMVMLAKAIARLELPRTQIVLVNDRIELDGQILRTFEGCHMDVVRAPTGPQLPVILGSGKSQIVTTVINKFESAVAAGLKLDNPNIFVFVDESHRSQFNIFHARMKQALPRGCYIGFTGTPVETRDKKTIAKFGGLIQPVYPIRQAVEDEAVVPLIYEGRDVPQSVEGDALDRWFERVTKDLSGQERADLKRKFSTADQLGKVETRVQEIALDISDHWATNWRGTGFKGQLVAPDKKTALLYKQFLDEIGQVSSEVLISRPDTREGHTETDESEVPPVQAHWKKMMDRFGSDEAYNDQIVAAFKNTGDPEILIVVSKLITGFDAPLNTVMYLTRPLEGHTLLQAIARVNRLSEGKEFGYILDYRGVLGQLNKALKFYDELARYDYDPADVEGTVIDIAALLKDLPARHAEVWTLFAGVNADDSEAMETHLSEPARRDDFYERLSAFARSLKVARSSARFLDETDEKTQTRYGRDLKFWVDLRGRVAQRYAEKVDYKAFEPQIQKLLDRHMKAEVARVVVEKINIFDRAAFAQEVARIEGDSSLSDAAKADQMAYRLHKSATAKIEDDPAFYTKFSRLIEDAIRAFADGRLADKTYLATVKELGEGLSDRTRAGFPASLHGEEIAQAFYGLLRPTLETHVAGDALDVLAADFALQTDKIIRAALIVNWQTNGDLVNKLAIELDDAWCDQAQASGFRLSTVEVESLLERVLEVAKRRYAR